MKKFFALILSVLTAISLCGCNAEKPEGAPDSDIENSTNEGSTTTESSTESSTESTESKPEESNPTESKPEEPPEPAEPLVLVGLDGEIVPEDDFISTWDNIPPSELTTENFSYAEVKGAYVALPSGICRTSLDNPDVFDSENLVFKDVAEEKKRDFIRVNEGDNICGFTVKSAVSGFSSNLANAGFGMNDDGSTIFGRDIGIPEIYFASSELELEGKAELTGYIAIQPEDEYGIDAGEIKFIPSDCKVELPVVYFDFNPTDGIYHRVGNVGVDGEIYYTHEYGYSFFRLGDVGSATASLSGVPRDGSYVKVRITVENIRLNSSVEWFTNVRGDITDITIL